MFGIPVLLVIVVVGIVVMGLVALAAVSLCDGGPSRTGRTVEQTYTSAVCGGVTGGDKAIRVNRYGAQEVMTAAGYWSV